MRARRSRYRLAHASLTGDYACSRDPRALAGRVNNKDNSVSRKLSLEVAGYLQVARDGLWNMVSMQPPANSFPRGTLAYSGCPETQKAAKEGGSAVLQFVVPGAGIEPARLAAGDFESPASTNFTTRASSHAGLPTTFQLSPDEPDRVGKSAIMSEIRRPGKRRAALSALNHRACHWLRYVNCPFRITPITLARWSRPT